MTTHTPSVSARGTTTISATRASSRARGRRRLQRALPAEELAGQEPGGGNGDRKPEQGEEPRRQQPIEESPRLGGQVAQRGEDIESGRVGRRGVRAAAVIARGTAGRR